VFIDGTTMKKAWRSIEGVSLPLSTSPAPFTYLSLSPFSASIHSFLHTPGRKKQRHLQLGFTVSLCRTARAL
jgi:hypothetical protein